MTTAATITVNLALNSSEFQNGIDNASKASDEFSQKWDKIGDKMMKIGAGMTLALTVPIVAFLKSSVQSAAESEAALADLEAVIKSTGGAAGVSADMVTEYADAMQQVTKFSDEAIIQGQSMLLTFTSIGSDVFPRASDAMLDMAQKFGTDLPQAAITLGKALNDPIGGVTALRRIGVQLTQEQEDQIKAFMAVNDVASAQGVILDELEKEVGGVAEAFGNTFAGKMEIFNNKLDDFKEKVGEAIIPSLIRFMDALTPLLDALADAPPWVMDFIVTFLGIVALAGPLTTFGGMIVKVFAFFSAGGGGGAAVAWIGKTLIPALGSIGTFITTTLWPAIVSLGTAIWGALAPIIVPLIVIIALVAGLAFVIWAFATDFMGVTTTLKQLIWIIGYEFKKMGETIKEAWNSAMETVRTEGSKSIEVWKNNFKQAQEINGKLWDLFILKMATGYIRFVTLFKTKLTEIQNWAVNTWNRISSAFTTAWNTILNFFNNVKNSILAGIQAIIDAVKNLIASLANIVLPDALTPGSPTPFEMGLRGIASAMKEISQNEIPQLNYAMAAPSGITGVGTGKTINYTDNRRFAPGLDAKALRMALDDRLNGLAQALENA